MVQTREQKNAKVTERRAKNRANGKCGCGKNRVKDSTQCEVCISKNKKYKEECKKKGLCFNCGKNPPDEGFKKCEDCRNRDKINKQTNWLNVKISNCRGSDLKHKRLYKEKEYLTTEDIIAFRKKRNYLCCYCDRVLQTKKMQKPDGLTIERIDNSKAHVKGNCKIACHRCNMKDMGAPTNCAKTRQERIEYLAAQKSQNDMRSILEAIIDLISIFRV